MNQPLNANPDTPGIRLLRILFEWYKPILLITFFATAGALVFTSPYFMPPYYKAEIIFYPPGTNSSKILIEKDPRFGADKEIDEQIQILKSSIVRDSIISSYHLVSHYKIDTTKKAWAYFFYKQLEDNITIERTRYNSISVKVYDTDPVLAATIANDIVRIGDEVKSAIIKANLQKAFESVSREYFEKSKQLDEVISSLNKFIEHPISTHVTRKDKSSVEKLKEQLDLQAAIEKAKSGGQLSQMESLYHYQLLLQQLSEIESSYFQAYLSLNSAIPSCYIITPAEVTNKKAGPRRALLVALALFSGFSLGTGLVVAMNWFGTVRKMVIRSEA